METTRDGTVTVSPLALKILFYLSNNILLSVEDIYTLWQGVDVNL